MINIYEHEVSEYGVRILEELSRKQASQDSSIENRRKTCKKPCTDPVGP